MIETADQDVSPTRPMQWQHLLNAGRIREIEGGAHSHTGGKEARSQFERDYARAVFCTPVRRLHDKAQVFPLDPNDSVRTRLTHSLEVSTVARSMAREVARWLVKEGHLDSEHSSSIEDIAATVGLLHDIGNPPFGHAGERAIQTWIEEREDSEGILDFAKGHASGDQLRSDFKSFEGNAQTMRLLSRLQFISDSYGLNLTVGSLSALRKYTAASHCTVEDDQSKKKPGHFFSETARIQLIDKMSETEGARNPIAYLVEACDDIVYSLVDLEDGVKKGVVTWREIREELLEKFPPVHDAAKRSEDYVSRRLGLPPRQSEECCAQMFRTFAMSYLEPLARESFYSNYSSIMSRRFRGDLLSESEAGPFLKELRSFLRRRIFPAAGILKLELMGRRVIHDLLDIFWRATKAHRAGRALTDFDEKAFHLLSFNYVSVFEEAMQSKVIPPEYCRIQLATDYVCGMTDGFACALHRNLTHAS